jgi:hypothetical protein
MADDETEDFEEPELEEELDEEVLAEDLDDEALADVDTDADDDTFTGDEVVVAGLEQDEGAATEPAPRARKKGEEEAEEEEDELDPDDVEADLDTILKDRIAATDDDDDDEDEVDKPDTRAGADTPDGVTPKRADEFMCTGCFLLVNPSQFGRLDCPRCPVGEEDCPAIRELTESRQT